MIKNTIDWVKAKLALEQAGADAIRRTAEFMAERARMYAPVDTGFLVSQIQVIASSGSSDVHVISGASYSEFVEFGFHHIAGIWIPPNPFMRKALADAAAEFPNIARGVRVDRPGGARDAAHLGATFTATT